MPMRKLLDNGRRADQSALPAINRGLRRSRTMHPHGAAVGAGQSCLGDRHTVHTAD
ncbi:MAG TPA: hypothetical protein VFA09_09130 [Ktedonobacteraceae bacterium]|nr:hypothetical protein [Ktedonobacteraceae bacterium]